MWRSLQIIGVRAAYERLDGRLADCPAEKQLDYSVLGHGTDTWQDFDEFIVTGFGPGQVDVLYVSPKRLSALGRQSVQNGLDVFGTAPVIDGLCDVTIVINLDTPVEYQNKNLFFSIVFDNLLGNASMKNGLKFFR